jgi:peroxiredoxin
LTRPLSRLFVVLTLFVLPLLGAVVPRPAPEFVIKTPDGRQVLLSQFRGKVVALEFLFTTCPHCQNCSQIMERVYKDLGPRGFQPLGAAFNPDAQLLVPEYVRQFSLTFPVGASPREPVLDFLQHSEVMRFLVPQLVFIDRKGVIRLQTSGEDDFFKEEEKNMRAEVEKLLAERDTSHKAAPGGARSSKSKSSKPAKPTSFRRP